MGNNRIVPQNVGTPTLDKEVVEKNDKTKYHKMAKYKAIIALYILR